MYQNYKVVVCTCSSGRLRHLTLMHKYMAKQFGLVDEWRLWINADKILDKDSPEIIKSLNPKHITIDLATKRYKWWTVPFYQHCCDPNTIYIKADDDIVFIADDAIEKLLAYRLKHPECFTVHANIVNNGICSFIHQQIGAIDEKFGRLGYRFNDPVAILSHDFINHLHTTFLETAEKNEEKKFKFHEWVMREYQEFSINCYAFFGKTWSEFGGYINTSDETWTTRIRPAEIGTPSRVCGQALVVHYAFFPQREYLDTRTDIFDRYEKLAEERCKKVFCISHPRNGTSSFTVFLEQHGLKCCHIDVPLRNSFVFADSLDWATVNKCDALSDIPFPIPKVYTLCDEKFPDAKFVLFERNVDDWLRSIEGLWKFNTKDGNEWYRLDENNPNTTINTLLYGSPKFDSKTWKNFYNQRLMYAKEYFKDRPEKLLVLNLYEDNDVKATKLCNFLGIVKKCTFPHKNSRSLDHTKIW